MIKSFRELRIYSRVSALTILMIAIVFVIASGLFSANHTSAQTSLDLTAEEQSWLDNVGVIRVGPAPNFPPVEYFDIQNIYRGMAADYLELIKTQTNAQFEVVQCESWSQVIERTKNGEIDVWLEAGKTEERSEYMLFTEPYLKLPAVIITRRSSGENTSLDDLKGQKVVVGQGYATEFYLNENYPDLEILPVTSLKSGLNMVSFGSADAIVMNIATASHYIEELGLANLVVSGESGFVWNLSIASRIDWPALSSIFQKVLNNITLDQRREINRRWIGLEAVPSQIDVTTIVVVSALILLLVVLIIATYYRRRLKKHNVVIDENQEQSSVLRAVSIRYRLIVIMSAVSIFSVGVIGYIGYFTAKTAHEEDAFNQLTAIREMKAEQVEDYFDLIRKQIQTFAEDRMVIDAMKQFGSGFNSIILSTEGDKSTLSQRDSLLVDYYQKEFIPRLQENCDNNVELNQYWPSSQNTRTFQSLYIASNPNEVGQKHLLTDAGDGSSYSETHAKYHPIMRNFLDRFGYYDIFFVDIETGNIVYTVFKEVDAGTSLLDGPYSTTSFAKAFLSVRECVEVDFVSLVDYAPYHPSYNGQASFIGAPIFEGNKKIGALLFQMPIDKINSIMTSKQEWKSIGLGESGETYIVGDDFKLRNQSRFLIEDKINYFNMVQDIGLDDSVISKIKKLNSTIGLQPVRTEGTEAALSGEIATRIFPDYRGVNVLSSYRPLNIPDVNWVIMSEIDEAEAFADVYSLRDKMLLSLAIIVAIIVFLSFWFSKSITAPLNVLTANARTLANGNLDVSINVSGRDEIGLLATSFDSMRQSLKGMVGELEDSNKNLEAKVNERTKEVEKISEQVRTIVNSAPDAIITMDANQVITIVNPQAEKVFGYTWKEMIGQPLTMLLPEQSRKNHFKEVEKFSREKVKTRMLDSRRPIAGQRKDGTVFPAEAGVARMEIDGKNYYTAHLKDITVRVEAERILNRQSAALGAAADGIVITDIDGIIEWVNPAFTKLTGYSREEAVGQNPRVLKSGAHDSDFYATMWTTVLDGDIWTGEVVNKHKDGSLFTEEMSINPVRNENNEIVAFVAIKRDITDRKLLEAQIKDAHDQAESANRAKSAFLANMSHELRTPMNAIIGYSEMLIEDAEDDENEAAVSDLKKINSAGTHLLSLINDILDLSKIEAGKMDLYLERFDLHKMLDESIATITPLIAKKNNRLVTDFADDLGEIRSDMTKMRQALFNLLSNAAKFTEHGTITLSAVRLRTESDDRIRISVTDTGIGIPQDRIEHVFEEFSQADESTTRQFGGTGLGLPISRKFCQMMGGDILASSKPGEGSTFTIDLPAKVDALEAAKKATQSVASKLFDSAVGGHPVLIIDDDPNARDLLERTLKDDGHEVLSAASGEIGLELARKHSPALITLDVMMPGMDGWEVLQQLKADKSLRDIPVVMITIVEEKALGYSLGALEYLSKPIDRKRLMQIAGQFRQHDGEGIALIVEDDESTRQLLSRALNDSGWQVTEASNGAMALEKFDKTHPDLIILDLMMPIMDGFEFVEQLRLRDDGKTVPIVVVTAKDLTEEDRQRLNGAVVHIIEKSAQSSSDLLAEVKQLAGRYSEEG